jgi:serine protease inhibitor
MPMDLERALLERLGGEDVVFSPLGLRRALEVVRRGARGRTRAALDKVLGPDTPPDVAVDDPAVVLYMATAAWLAEGYAPGPALAGLDVGPLAVEPINAWARERTRGMIPSVIEKVADYEKLAITDAVYMDAAWTDPFDPAKTRPRPFEGAGEVAMMDVAGRFSYAEQGELRAVRLPYGNHELEFVGVLGEGDWRELTFQRRQGRVELPRFTATSRLELTDHLQALGLGPAFEPGDELEALFTGPGAKALSQILQRARADIDEQGTKAAAVTVVTAMAISAVRADPPPPFHIVFDRPFTWAVEHGPTGALLFLGRVHHPTERSD